MMLYGLPQIRAAHHVPGAFMDVEGIIGAEDDVAAPLVVARRDVSAVRHVARFLGRALLRLGQHVKSYLVQQMAHAIIPTCEQRIQPAYVKRHIYGHLRPFPDKCVITPTRYAFLVIASDSGVCESERKERTTMKMQTPQQPSQQQQPPLMAWWRRQMAVYRADIARWTQRLPWLHVQQPFGQRIGRAVQPVRIGKQAVAPWVIGVVLGAFALVSIIMSIMERVGR